MPNNDYILRSDALKAILGVSIYDTIEELEGARTIAENTWADGLYDAYKIIEEEVDAADVEPKRKWIPVTERLPEVGKEVLIYAVGKTEDFSSVIEITNRMIFRLLPSSEGVETWSPPRQYFMTNYEITHWMPLPEPPKSWTDNPWCNAVDKALESEPPKGEENAEEQTT